MKKQVLLIILVVFIITFSIGGCGAKKAEDGSMKIVTSFYPMYIMALNIVGDTKGVEIENLASPDTGCLHDYQLKPADMVKIEEADVFLANGGGMENFIDEVLRAQNDLNILYATDGIDMLESYSNSEEVHNHDHEHDHEEEGEYNAHTWMDLSLYAKEVLQTANQLGMIDEKNKDVYEKNANDYVDKIKALENEIKTMLIDVKDQKVVILHDAFAYFAREFDFSVVHSLEVETDAGLSAKQIKNIIDDVSSANAAALIAEKQYSGNIAQTIGQETGIKPFVLDSCVTGALDKDAYLNAMKENAMIVKEALSHE